MTNVIGLGKALVGDGGTDVLPVLSLLHENSDWWIELCDECDTFTIISFIAIVCQRFGMCVLKVQVIC